MEKFNAIKMLEKEQEKENLVNTNLIYSITLYIYIYNIRSANTIKC